METKRYTLNTSEWLAKVRDEDMWEQEKRNSNLKELGGWGLLPQHLPVEILIGAPLHSTQGCVGKCVTLRSPREKKSVLVHGVCWLPRWNSSYRGWFLSQPCDSWKHFGRCSHSAFCSLLNGVFTVSRWSISCLIILAVTFRKPKYIQRR